MMCRVTAAQNCLVTKLRALGASAGGGPTDTQLWCARKRAHTHMHTGARNVTHAR